MNNKLCKKCIKICKQKAEIVILVCPNYRKVKKELVKVGKR